MVVFLVLGWLFFNEIAPWFEQVYHRIFWKGDVRIISRSSDVNKDTGFYEINGEVQNVGKVAVRSIELSARARDRYLMTIGGSLWHSSDEMLEPGGKVSFYFAFDHDVTSRIWDYKLEIENWATEPK